MMAASLVSMRPVFLKVLLSIIAHNSTCDACSKMIDESEMEKLYYVSAV